MRLYFSDPANFFTTDMTYFKEQRICIKFCCNLKNNCCRKPPNATGRQCHEPKQNFYGTNASRMDEHLLTTTSDLDDSTSKTPENIAEVREAILADCRQTIHNVCEIVGLSYGTVQHILADSLNMRRISARFVPRLLSNDQKSLRVSVCRELKQQARDDPNFISNIIAGDETWMYGYDAETKQQSSQWKSPNSPQPKKARQVCSHVKSMLIVFFDIQDIVYKRFVPPCQTINGKFYCEILKWLREGIQCKRPDRWKKNSWFLHHDNAPTHTSLIV
jgi:hypothetical protein